jgi:DNA-directed RNA polymerase subunit omega
MQPPIDELLEKTENDKFLLCVVASERARDINDMMRGQRDRAKVLNSANQIAQLAGRKPLSLAMEEIERGEISYNRNKFHNREIAEGILDDLDEEGKPLILSTLDSLDTLEVPEVLGVAELLEVPEVSEDAEASEDPQAPEVPEVPEIALELDLETEGEPEPESESETAS